MIIFTPQTSAAAFTTLFPAEQKLVFKSSNSIYPVKRAKIVDVASKLDMSSSIVDFLKNSPPLSSKILIISSFTDRTLHWLLEQLSNWPYIVQVISIAPFYPAISTLDLKTFLLSLAALHMYKIPCAIIEREEIEYIPQIPAEAQLLMLNYSQLHFAKIVNSPVAALNGALQTLKKTAFDLRIKRLHVICQYVRDCTPEILNVLSVQLKGIPTFAFTRIHQTDFWVMVASRDNLYDDTKEFVAEKVRSAVGAGVLPVAPLLFAIKSIEGM